MVRSFFCALLRRKVVKLAALPLAIAQLCNYVLLKPSPKITDGAARAAFWC